MVNLTSASAECCVFSKGTWKWVPLFKVHTKLTLSNYSFESELLFKLKHESTVHPPTHLLSLHISQQICSDVKNVSLALLSVVKRGTNWIYTRYNQEEGVIGFIFLCPGLDFQQKMLFFAINDEKSWQKPAGGLWINDNSPHQGKSSLACRRTKWNNEQTYVL